MKEKNMKEKVIDFVKIALIALILIVPITRFFVIIKALLFAALVVLIFFIEPKLKGINVEDNARSYFKLSIVIIIFLAILFAEVYFTFWKK